MNAFNRTIARLLVVCLTCLGLPLPAMAGLVGTPQLVAQAERSQVQTYLERTEVRERLQSMGVDPKAARARVEAMTDDEVVQLAQHIDAMPAGAGVIGIAFTVFVVLLVTDILGFTKVFPFTRSIR